jgi:hypothetical protein
MTVGEYQLLFREINVADEVPVDNKALAYADEVRSAVGQLLRQQALHLSELHRHDTRLAVGEDKRGIVAVRRYEYNVFRGCAHQINASRYDQIFPQLLVN